MEHRFSGVMQPENFSAHGDGWLLNDHRYDYKFHSPFDRPDYENDPDYAAKLMDHQEKARHLTSKFLRKRPDGHATAYFYKVSVFEEAGAALQMLPRLRDILSEVHGAAPYVIIALTEEERGDAPWGLPHIHNRTLRRFAPWNDAPDGHVPSWDRLFFEFPHKQPMRFAGY